MGLVEPQERIDDGAYVARRPSPPRSKRQVIETLVEKYRGRRFAELVRDPDFKRLSELDVQALAAEYRREAKRLGAEADEAPSLRRRNRWPSGLRIRRPSRLRQERV
jgi:hypothetical protein